MQTFLPHKNFKRCAEALDTRRLGKQIIEARQIGKAILDPSYGWQNHPAVRMWRGHPSYLLLYADSMNREWKKRRGKSHGAYKNMLKDPIAEIFDEDEAPPKWLSSKEFRVSHRSNLYRKDPVHYAQYAEYGPDLPYVWPV